ncbi:4Fe4S-binding leucine-rich repeat protein [Paraburkholderia dilworthii]|uniref:4Fe4S-binding leucine-rich repeat protein n=1 Tax=Paraburkholderia dilworthii TaxID=948106 RepID=UPI000482BCD9|nr:4Fe4S-binding leucine-rich repeat protein [Paraburkholderia dilworthii]
MSAQNLRVRGGDIAPRHWQGGPLDSAGCGYVRFRELPAEHDRGPGHERTQDAYARRIERFFHWHPEVANEQPAHPYFDVRAIAASHADVFCLPALLGDPDETGRLHALRLPQAQHARLIHDPHREVRIRVAQHGSPAALISMRGGSDYGVREWVAQHLRLALLPPMLGEPDRAVRMRLAERLEMPELLRIADGSGAEGPRMVAQRLPATLLSRLAADPDGRVRWEVARRAAAEIVPSLVDGADEQVRALARQRRQSGEVANLMTSGQTQRSAGVKHG